MTRTRDPGRYDGSVIFFKKLFLPFFYHLFLIFFVRSRLSTFPKVEESKLFVSCQKGLDKKKMDSVIRL